MYKLAPLPMWIGVKETPGRGAAEDTIVVAVPVELKSLLKPIEALIAAAQEAMRSASGTHAVDYAATERVVEEHVAAIERATHAELLASLDVNAERVEIGGKVFRRVHRCAGDYFTMAGPVSVERTLYREEGLREGETTDAITRRAGVVGRGWLPKTASSMAHYMQGGTSRDAEATARQSGRLPYCRATFDRVAHEIGEDWLHHHADIEDELAQAFEIPENACSVSVALDRVCVPMEEPLAKPRGRPRKNAPKNPVERVFRQAYCGTVTLHDDTGTSLHTIRYGCMPQSDPEALCTSMANEVFRLLQRAPGLTISLLADSAPEMWNLLEAALPEDLFGPMSRRIDFWHFIEKLCPAAKVIYGDENALAVLWGWRRDLRRRKGAAGDILAELVQSRCEWKWRNGDQPVHDAITYIDNHQERMNYADALRNNLPIGSGNVEATCKTLVAVRMKRAGARWKHQSGEHILRLRALAQSDRWDGAMEFLRRERCTAVRIAA